jgi:hypothetical protein
MDLLFHFAATTPENPRVRSDVPGTIAFTFTVLSLWMGEEGMGEVGVRWVVKAVEMVSAASHRAKGDAFVEVLSWKRLIRFRLLFWWSFYVVGRVCCRVGLWVLCFLRWRGF